MVRCSMSTIFEIPKLQSVLKDADNSKDSQTYLKKKTEWEKDASGPESLLILIKIN